MSAAPKVKITPAEYLEAERRAEFKSEFTHGEIFSMAGAGRNHNHLAGNLYSELHAFLKNNPCEVFNSDMRVSPTGDSYYYPDVSVACSKIKFLDNQQDTLLNPSVIIEVLSPSTADYDRGGKFVEYRKIASLQDYVLVSQDQILVEHHSRQSEGSWLLREYRKLSDTMTLSSLNLTIPLSVIYERVDIPT